MRIVKLSDLHNAEMFGTCAECGENSDNGQLYRIVTECIDGPHIAYHSLCLCDDCLKKLKGQIDEIYDGEGLNDKENN